MPIDRVERSTELIYRAWPRLELLRDEHHNEDARTVLAKFQGEFAQILAGDSGVERQQAARDFVDHFRPLTSGIACSIPNTVRGLRSIWISITV